MGVAGCLHLAISVDLDAAFERDGVRRLLSCAVLRPLSPNCPSDKVCN